MYSSPNDPGAVARVAYLTIGDWRYQMPTMAEVLAASLPAHPESLANAASR